MSHISDPIIWNDAIFAGFRIEPERLVLDLEDNTSRYMKYENWGADTEKTAGKLRGLKPGAAIRVATWGGYDESKWFCDIEESLSGMRGYGER